MKEESLLLLSDLQKLINQVVLIDYTIIILGCDVVCVNLVDRTDEGIEAVKNEEMLGTVYNDKDGQAREMLNLAFAIATDGDKSDIPLIDGKYVRMPYHKITLENIEEYE